MQRLMRDQVWFQRWSGYPVHITWALGARVWYRKRYGGIDNTVLLQYRECVWASGEKMGEQKVSQAKVPVVWNFAGK